MVRYLDPEENPERHPDMYPDVDPHVYCGEFSSECAGELPDVEAKEDSAHCLDSDLTQGASQRTSRRKSRRAVTPGERLAQLRERHAQLTGVEAIEAAREVALRKLDRRSCSRAELHKAITERGFNADTASEVLDRLESVGLVDDRQFAAMIVRDRFALKGAVGRAIIEELRRKGISRDIIDEVMTTINTDDEYARATQLVERKLPTMVGIPRNKAWTRLAGMLARKGYSSSVVTSVLGDALCEWEWPTD